MKIKYQVLINKQVNTSVADVQFLRPDTLMVGPFSRVSIQCMFFYLVFTFVKYDEISLGLFHASF